MVRPKILLTSLARLVLITAVVWLVVTTVMHYREMMGGFASTHSEVVEQPTDRLASPVAILSELPPEGYWTFADWNWAVGQDQVPAEEVQQRLNRARATTPETMQNSVDAGNWGKFFDQLGMKKTNTGEKISYRLQQEDLKVHVQMMTSGGKNLIVGVSVAFPEQSGSWKLLEFTPTNPRTSTLDKNDTLLPIPGSPRRICARWTHDDSLLLEFLAVDSMLESLLDNWGSAGWRPKPLDHTGSNSFTWLCAKEDREVYAWIPDSESQVNRLLLVDTSHTRTTSKN